jgi:hypothetical protein
MKGIQYETIEFGEDNGLQKHIKSIWGTDGLYKIQQMQGMVDDSDLINPGGISLVGLFAGILNGMH